MNAENNSCLSTMKGYCPDSRKYYYSCIAEIFDIEFYSEPFYADSVKIQLKVRQR